jgi:hypothetical protein
MSSYLSFSNSMLCTSQGWAEVAVVWGECRHWMGKGYCLSAVRKLGFLLRPTHQGSPVSTVSYQRRWEYTQPIKVIIPNNNYALVLLFISFSVLALFGSFLLCALPRCKWANPSGSLYLQFGCGHNCGGNRGLPAYACKFLWSIRVHFT